MDGTPIIDAWSGSCDDDTFQQHVFQVLQDFQEHPLGWLLAELGWQRGEHIKTRSRAPEP